MELLFKKLVSGEWSIKNIRDSDSDLLTIHTHLLTTHHSLLALLFLELVLLGDGAGFHIFDSLAAFLCLLI